MKSGPSEYRQFLFHCYSQAYIRNLAGSLDHLVGLEEEDRRNRQAERLRGLQVGVAGVIGGFFTVVEVAKIITLWPRYERLSNSWKINGRIRAHRMGFLAPLITAATERSWLL